MPKTRRPPSQSTAEDDGDASAAGKAQNSKASTPIPAHLLQSWASAIRKDADDADTQNDSDDGEESDGSEDDDSDWSTESEAELFGLQVGGKDNSVQVTYIIGMPPSPDVEEEDSDEWEDDDDGEQSVDSDEDDDESEPDSDELEEVAAVIAEMINEAMAEEAAAEKAAKKKRRGGMMIRKKSSKEEDDSDSDYDPDESEDDGGEKTANKRSPVNTRSRNRVTKKKQVRRNSTKAGPAPTKKTVVEKSPGKKPKVQSKTKKQTKKGDDSEDEEEDVEQMEKMLKMLKKREGSKSADADDNEIEKALIKQFDETVEKMKKEKKAKEEKAKKKAEMPLRKKNHKEFRKLLRGKQNQHPVDYFDKQSVERQKDLLKLLRAARKEEGIEVPATVRILESKAPESAKQLALRQALLLSKADDSEEMQKVKNWIDAFMRIPFGNYIELPIRLGSNPGTEIQNFMVDARTHLDSVAYGLNDAKTKLIEVLGQWIANPKCSGTSIALKGPMGTGKTTLIKEGLSKIIQRPFEFIALGGSTDGCTLEGHSYTYVGSTWGEIVSILLRSKCMNPVIYFDELDKISQSPRGQEIAGILTHLTDTSQNSLFHDKYFAGVPLDLSRVVFVFSYNDESLVNPILLNRMYKIETKGYSKKDKAIIAKDYMLPALLKEYALTEDDVTFDEDAIDYLANVVSGEEKGVRDLKRGITTCLAKINLLRLGVPMEQVVLGHPGDTKKQKKVKKEDKDQEDNKEQEEEGKKGQEEKSKKEEQEDKKEQEVKPEIEFPLVVTQKLASKLVRAAENSTPFNMYT